MYRKDLDALKGFAIVTVVLFHMGLLKSGYLGVDVFFVINGFLVIPSVIKKIEHSDYSFFGFMEKRIIHLLPLIVLASAISLGLGYFLMLPDHYENLAQSVIAGNFMSENILSAITTKNYWDVVNEYKPLMHLWYVGILFEFYIVFPILMLVANKCAILLKQDRKKGMVASLSIFTVCSLILYVLPFVSITDKFYFLHYRFFELGIGGLIAIAINNRAGLKITSSSVVQNIITCLLFVVICCSIVNVLTGNNIQSNKVIGKVYTGSNGMPFSPQIALLLTVVLSAIVVSFKVEKNNILNSTILAWLGKMSYSIFIWHQVLLAFYRYSISYDMDVVAVILFLLVTLIVSTISYYLVEKKITTSHLSFASWAVAALLVILPSGYLFVHAGVVRDVPELGVVKGTEHRGMFGEYCDRVYSYKEFPSEKNRKYNVLVEGYSFGRDFANILLESNYRDSINLCYAFLLEDEGVLEKAKNADYIFTFRAKEDVPKNLINSLSEKQKIFGIGTKNYGSCNGIIYKNRYESDYFSQSAQMENGYKALNDEWKISWGDDYIDLLTPVLLDDKHVRVFTDDNFYFSQDCRHLTQAGARWYANVLDWKKYFSK